MNDIQGLIGAYNINTIKDNKYVLYAITENLYNDIIKDASACSTTMQINNFYDKYGIRPQDIIIDGTTDVWKESYENRKNIEDLLKSVLPKPITVKNEITNTILDSFKCWCVGDLNIDEICDHRTVLDSWHCLMNKIGNPKYVIIVKEENK